MSECISLRKHIKKFIQDVIIIIISSLTLIFTNVLYYILFNSATDLLETVLLVV